MLFIDILGYFGSLLVGVAFIPQTYYSCKNEDSIKSISNYFLLLIILSSILLLSYSSYYKIIPMIITNILVLLNNLVILILKLRMNISKAHECISKL